MSKLNVQTVTSADGRTHLAERLIATMNFPYLASRDYRRRRPGKEAKSKRYTRCAVCGNLSKTNPCHKHAAEADA
ncbi:MAG: hypothetical protein AB7U73_08235 [Pirellulales bacterium]